MHRITEFEAPCGILCCIRAMVARLDPNVIPTELFN
jgi:hypothetical protein